MSNLPHTDQPGTLLTATLETPCCSSTATAVNIGEPNSGTWSATIVRCDACPQEYALTLHLRASGRNTASRKSDR